MAFIQFISAFGLGAVVTALIQSWFAQRSELSKRNFTEKKDSYIGYLDAIYQSEVSGTTEASLNVGRWQSRIALVGSEEVIKACEKILETNPAGGNAHPARPHALQNLKNAMRRDLGFGDK